MFRRDLPLYRVILIVWISFCLMLWFHTHVLGVQVAWHWPGLWWFFAGMIYTHFFEYFYHRIPMHRGIKHLEFLKHHHNQHHQMFFGVNFRRTELSKPDNLISHPLVFPSLFVVNYFTALPVMPLSLMPFFFAGVCFYYGNVFEFCHWYTHLKDNWFDNILEQIPVIDKIRYRQIFHHRIHHQTPLTRFNFNPPFAGDIILRTMNLKSSRKKK